MRGQLLAIALALVTTISASAQAQAQTSPDPRTAPQTVLTFDGETVEGDRPQPEAQLVVGRKPTKHSGLMAVREDFKAKVMQSVSEL